MIVSKGLSSSTGLKSAKPPLESIFNNLVSEGPINGEIVIDPSGILLLSNDKLYSETGELLVFIRMSTDSLPEDLKLENTDTFSELTIMKSPDLKAG
jgi:hypothetical protein